MPLLEKIPLWPFFIIIIGLAMLCVEAGYRFGKRRRNVADHDPEAPVGAMVASTLALLAFLLTFTFSIAAARFDERRIAVLNEANAIGTAYLRADFLDEQMKRRVRGLLREYVDMRIRISEATVAEQISQSEAIQDKLWAEAAAAEKAHPTPSCALFISSINEVIDLHAKRVTVGFYARVPLIVWICLLVVACLSMTGVGYQCGLAGNRSWTGTIILVTSFGFVILLVADLDRPAEGLIRTNQQPLIDLSKKLRP